MIINHIIIIKPISALGQAAPGEKIRGAYGKADLCFCCGVFLLFSTLHRNFTGITQNSPEFHPKFTGISQDVCQNIESEQLKKGYSHNSGLPTAAHAAGACNII